MKSKLAFILASQGMYCIAADRLGLLALVIICLLALFKDIKDTARTTRQLSRTTYHTIKRSQK